MMRSLKRVFDVAFALFGLLLVLPVLIVIAAIVKVDSPGPVLYRGERVGKDRRRFGMLKFRTMQEDAERVGGPSTADGDPRVTKAGRFLRKYKLDELPQLINVLRGEMSFIGPRPEVPRYVELFTNEEQEILSVRPGITDWASLWNADEGAVLAGSPDPEKTYLETIRPQKIRLQLEYVRKQSLWTDVVIIAQTLAVVVLRIRPKRWRVLDESRSQANTNRFR